MKKKFGTFKKNIKRESNYHRIQKWKLNYEKQIGSIKRKKLRKTLKDKIITI